MCCPCTDGQSAAAERLRVDFKVPERRFWRLKIKGLGHARNFEALRDLSLMTRSPIWFGLLVEVCMEQGAHDEAARYAADGRPLMRSGLL